MSYEPNVRIRLSQQKRLESSAEGSQRRCRRNLRWQAVPDLRARNRKCSAANSGMVNRRLNEAVAAGRAKSSATWKVGNVSERAKVRRYTTTLYSKWWRLIQPKIRHKQHKMFFCSAQRCGCLQWFRCMDYKERQVPTFSFSGLRTSRSSFAQHHHRHWSYVHCYPLLTTELFRSLLIVSGTNYHATSRLHRPLCEFSAVVLRLTFSAVPFRLSV